MNALPEALIDALERGEAITVIELEAPCRFPTYTPSTGYHRGCRCKRCWEGELALRKLRHSDYRKW